VSSSVDTRATRARLANLPIPSTPLFGREHEVAAVRELILAGPRRLVTLTGPGGVGKTRLALRIAAGLRDHFDDRVAFVPLAAERDAEALPLSILSSLDAEIGIAAPAGAPALDRLLGSLRDRQMLLVLDNLEQLASGVTVLSTLLSACPGLRILATSRVRLRLSDEQEFPVAPLPVPDDSSNRDDASTNPAVNLFLDRARALRPEFEPTG